MRPSGTIYKSSSRSNKGELRIALTKEEKKHFKIMRFIGVNLSSFALAFAVFFYGPNFDLDLKYQAGVAKAEQTVNQKDIQTEVVSEEVQKPDEKPDIFSLSIPTIGATATVIKNVDPFNKDEYSNALKEGIAQAKGTGLPGEGRRIYLFAHSTNSPLNFAEYNAIFYQLRLLNEGDRIFVNYNGDIFLYVVKQKVIVQASDTHWLTETTNKEQLVLQTCDPPGTTLRRLLVIAEPTN